MHISQLYIKFKASLGWNATLFFVYKVLFTLTSLLLFYRLSVNDFSLWANLNSLIFLLLLWLDFGFRKSIPRFCLEFKDKGSRCRFLYYLLGIHVLVFLSAIPLFLYIVTIFFRSISLSCNTILLFIGAGIFFVEGSNSTIRLFYHAHFWNKQYTLIQIIFLFSEMVLNVLCICRIFSYADIIVTLFMNKLLISSSSAVVSFFLLNRYYRSSQLANVSKVQKRLIKTFIAHSGMMWFGNSIKSLSERNFLVPLLTYAVSPAVANLFKVANDWAMLIHRPIIKTIGSSDTALLTHLQADKSAISTAVVDQLTYLIMIICIPFCCTIPLLVFFIPVSALLIFFIITAGHITETIFSPYERMLEVKCEYKLLFLAYIPYLLALGGVAWYFSSCSLLIALISIYLSRISSSLLMAHFARQRKVEDVERPSTSLRGAVAYSKKEPVSVALHDRNRLQK